MPQGNKLKFNILCGSEPTTQTIKHLVFVTVHGRYNDLCDILQN